MVGSIGYYNKYKVLRILVYKNSRNSLFNSQSLRPTRGDDAVNREVRDFRISYPRMRPCCEIRVRARARERLARDVWSEIALMFGAFVKGTGRQLMLLGESESTDAQEKSLPVVRG